MSRYLVVLFILLLAVPAAAQRDQRVEVSAVWSQDQARPGDQRVLAVVLDLDPGWHVYPNPEQTVSLGDFQPLSTTVDITAPDTLSIGPLQYPKPHDLHVSYANGSLKVWDGKVVIYAPVTVSPNAVPGSAEVSVSVFYQTCDDTVCLIPQTVDVAAPLEVVAPGTPIEPAEDSALFADFDPAGFAETHTQDAAQQVNEPASQNLNFYFFQLDPGGAGFVVLLAVAALGGFLLNLTPCVLPVIPIKIMSLAGTAGSRGRTFALGLAMCLGIILFWMAMALVIGALENVKAVNQLFQMPAFTLGVGVFIAVMAVGMCGVFSLQLPQWVYRISPKQESLVGSMGFGVMTAVLSTPCTAPFMGVAAAWAVTQSSIVTLSTFGAIGVGMALPYFLLASFPKMVERVPRTGPGSELLKQIMGILMLSAAAFFVGSGINALISDGTAETSKVFWWAVFGFIALAGGWLAVQSIRVLRTRVGKAVFAGLGVLMLVGSAAVGIPMGMPEGKHGVIDWVYYTPDRLEEALGRGDVVVMDFTADWCLNCKALERTVLESRSVSGLLAEQDVVPMKVDITSSSNKAGTEMLRKNDRVTRSIGKDSAQNANHKFDQCCFCHTFYIGSDRLGIMF